MLSLLRKRVCRSHFGADVAASNLLYMRQLFPYTATTFIPVLLLIGLAHSWITPAGGVTSLFNTCNTPERKILQPILYELFGAYSGGHPPPVGGRRPWSLCPSCPRRRSLFSVWVSARFSRRVRAFFFFLALTPPPSSPDHQIGYIDVRGAPSNARYTALV